MATRTWLVLVILHLSSTSRAQDAPLEHALQEDVTLREWLSARDVDASALRLERAADGLRLHAARNVSSGELLLHVPASAIMSAAVAVSARGPIQRVAREHEELVVPPFMLALALAREHSRGNKSLHSALLATLPQAGELRGLPIFGDKRTLELLRGTDAGALLADLDEEVRDTHASLIRPFAAKYEGLFARGRPPALGAWRLSLALVWCCSAELDAHGRAILPFVSSARHWQPGMAGAEGARLSEDEDNSVRLTALRPLRAGEEVRVDLGARRSAELLVARGELAPAPAAPDGAGRAHCVVFHMDEGSLRERAAAADAAEAVLRQRLLREGLGVPEEANLALGAHRVPAPTVSALRVYLAEHAELRQLVMPLLATGEPPPEHVACDPDSFADADERPPRVAPLSRSTELLVARNLEHVTSERLRAHAEHGDGDADADVLERARAHGGVGSRADAAALELAAAALRALEVETLEACAAIARARVQQLRSLPEGARAPEFGGYYTAAAAALRQQAESARSAAGSAAATTLPTPDDERATAHQRGTSGSSARPAGAGLGPVGEWDEAAVRGWLSSLLHERAASGAGPADDGARGGEQRGAARAGECAAGLSGPDVLRVARVHRAEGEGAALDALRTEWQLSGAAVGAAADAGAAAAVPLPPERADALRRVLTDARALLLAHEVAHFPPAAWAQRGDSVHLTLQLRSATVDVLAPRQAAAATLRLRVRGTPRRALPAVGATDAIDRAQLEYEIDVPLHAPVQPFAGDGARPGAELARPLSTVRIGRSSVSVVLRKAHGPDELDTAVEWPRLLADEPLERALRSRETLSTDYAIVSSAHEEEVAEDAENERVARNVHYLEDKFAREGRGSLADVIMGAGAPPGRGDDDAQGGGHGHGGGPQPDFEFPGADLPDELQDDELIASLLARREQS